VEKNSKKKVTIEQETLGEAGVIFFLVLFGLISFVVGVGTLLFGGILWGLFLMLLGGVLFASAMAARG